MSNFTVYQGIQAFAKEALTAFYTGSKTAIFNDPENQIYSVKGTSVKVREIEAPNAGTYDTSKGWSGLGGAGGSVKWVEYTPELDRGVNLNVDARDELASFEEGTTPSITLLATNFVNSKLTKEADATNIAKFYNRLPGENIIGDGETWASPKYILDNLADLEAKIFDSGYDGDTVLFLASTAYNSLRSAIIEHNGLANPVLTETTIDIDIPNPVHEDGDDESVIHITMKVTKYLSFYLVEMPKDRMYTKIAILSGDASEGQGAGGYLPDTTNAGYSTIKALAIPLGAAFTNCQYLVANYSVPASFYADLGVNEVEQSRLSAKSFGAIHVDNAYINQLSNAFTFNLRAIYGGDLFECRRGSCFGVVDSVTSHATIDTNNDEYGLVLDSTDATAKVLVKVKGEDIAVSETTADTATVTGDTSDFTVDTTKVTAIAVKAKSNAPHDASIKLTIKNSSNAVVKEVTFIVA